MGKYSAKSDIAIWLRIRDVIVLYLMLNSYTQSELELSLNSLILSSLARRYQVPAAWPKERWFR